MPKKKGISKAEQLNAHLHELNEQLTSKTAEASRLQEALNQANGQIRQLQEDAAISHRLESNVHHLQHEQREAASSFNQYENQVLMLELQSLVERYRIMDVEALSQQNHELREEVMQLQAENMELSRALAASAQRARQDVAKIHLALEAAARDTLASARERLCRELHEQLDDRLKLLVEEHGTLQESTMVLSEQAAELDKQYRSLVTDRRQYKVDAEIGNSMQDMQNRQIVLLKHQLERMGLTVQMLQVKCEEQVNRAEAADGRATAAAHTAARLQAQVARLQRAQQLGGTMDEGIDGADDADLDDELVKLRNQVSSVQRKADQSKASCEQWKRKAHMYERTCAQLQAALQALQQFPPGSTLARHSTPGSAIKAIWSSEPQRSDTGLSSRVTPDPSGVLGELSCLSSFTPRDGQATPTSQHKQLAASSQVDDDCGASDNGQRSAVEQDKLSAASPSFDDRSKVQDQALDATSGPTPAHAKMPVHAPRLMSARPHANSNVAGSTGRALRPVSAVAHTLGVMPHTLAQSRMIRSWSSHQGKRPMSAMQGVPRARPSPDVASSLEMARVGADGNSGSSPRPGGMSVQGLTVSRLHSPWAGGLVATSAQLQGSQSNQNQATAQASRQPASAQPTSSQHGHTQATSARPCVVYQPQPHTTAAASMFQGLTSPMPARPKTALQPKGLRPGSSRYFSAVSNDPFLQMD